MERRVSGSEVRVVRGPRGEALFRHERIALLFPRRNRLMDPAWRKSSGPTARSGTWMASANKSEHAEPEAEATRMSMVA